MLPPASDLCGTGVKLRRPIAEDVDSRFALGQHKEVVAGYGISFDPTQSYSRDEAEAEIRLIANSPYGWIIDVGKLVGHIRLHSVDHHDRRAILAIGIADPSNLGRGIGAEAIRLVLRHAFKGGLHRISLRVIAYNARAIACYKKCGFKEEGREREAALVGGVRHDDIIMGILAHEFGFSN